MRRGWRRQNERFFVALCFWGIFMVFKWLSLFVRVVLLKHWFLFSMQTFFLSTLALSLVLL